MKIILFLFILLPGMLIAQEKNSLRFEKETTWQQVLAKAKQENKYILVDCYTTWCAPCRKMEKEVYPLSKVGDFYNDKFIAVKFQMDSAKNDDDATKATYADARYIEKNYQINSYPTFLFFGSDGKILRRMSSGLEADEFIKLGTDVIDPKKNYYGLLAEYEHGKRDLDAMSYLAITALELIKDTTRSAEIAKAYMNLNLKTKDLLTEDNIDFITRFTKSTKDKGFLFLYNNTASVDKIKKDNMYAQGFIRTIIFNEMVRPALPSHEDIRKPGIPDPNWNQLALAIRQKYNAYYSDFVIASVKMDWYQIRKKWSEHATCIVKYVEKYVINTNNQGPWVAFAFNNYAWGVFEDSQNKDELNKALSWSARAVLIDPQPNWMDTYANLLYKLGQKNLALKWEKDALTLEPFDSSVQEMYRKMKKGEPTWPQK